MKDETIDGLKVEVERLRAALQTLVEDYGSHSSLCFAGGAYAECVCPPMWRAAREALNPTPMRRSKVAEEIPAHPVRKWVDEVSDDRFYEEGGRRFGPAHHGRLR